MVYATAWDCLTTGDEQQCIVTATSTADMVASSTASTSPEMASTTPYYGMSYQESLFIGCALLFFVSFMAWGRFFRKD